jgi:hypothetical protein
MNIFLDSNVWLEDKHLESTGFSSLCAYLKRTDSSIVLPNLVLEEVLGEYDRTLLEKCEKTFQAGKHVLKHLIRRDSIKNRFDLDIDVRGETEAFRKRLLEPAHGIKTVQVDESKVDIREVYRRGIKRKRPANQKGEELRDVILWLTVLQYAVDTKAKVALISRDSGFWDGENLHAELKGDITSYGVEISAYKDIESFNKANALRSSLLAIKDVQNLFDVRKLDGKAIERVAQEVDALEAENSIAHFRQGGVVAAEFGEGTLYDVAEDIQFAEVSYQADILAQIVLKDKPKPSSPWDSITAIMSGTVPAVPTNFSRLRALSDLAPTEPKEIETEFRALYTGQVSMRIIKGQAHSADFESFEFLKFVDEVAVTTAPAENAPSSAG